MGIPPFGQFLLGAGWYTLLGPAWMAGSGKTEAQLVAEHGRSPLPYIIALGAALALALIASTLAMNYGFEARPLSLWLIYAGYMTQEGRATLCISSQVGCALDCAFCSTGKQASTAT